MNQAVPADRSAYGSQPLPCWHLSPRGKAELETDLQAYKREPDP